MEIYAIADLHLSKDPAVEKPMDIFGAGWERHDERLKEDWVSRVTDEDLVIVAGDISWGLKLSEAEADLAWLESLPGKKLLVRGNHDLWWSSLSKMKALCKERGWESLNFLQNDCYIAETQADVLPFRRERVPELSSRAERSEVERSPSDQGTFCREATHPERSEGTPSDQGASCREAPHPERSEGSPSDQMPYVICGTRGWICPGSSDFTEHDRKIYERELLRLEMSLKAVEGKPPLICALHYPPTNERFEPSGFTKLFEKYGVSQVVYGHLHGANVWPRGLQGERNGVRYDLVSLDYRSCTLLKLTE